MSSNKRQEHNSSVCYLFLLLFSYDDDDNDAFLHLYIQVAFLDEKSEYIKSRTGRRKEEEEEEKKDVFHLDDVTKDYLKGKDLELMLKDR